MTEQKPEEPKTEKKKKLPINFMVNEFMDQQLTTLDNHIPEGSGDATAGVGGSIPSTRDNNLNKKGGEKDADTNANGRTTN